VPPHTHALKADPADSGSAEAERLLPSDAQDPGAEILERPGV
jgi:hypothetical protein